MQVNCKVYMGMLGRVNMNKINIKFTLYQNLSKRELYRMLTLYEMYRNNIPSHW